MTIKKLRFLSEVKLIELSSDKVKNRERYKSSDFLDMVGDNGWSVESRDIYVDFDLLSELNPSLGSEAEVKNSQIVYEAFIKMNPAVASDARTWVRLTHVECLDFCRARWIKDPSDEKVDTAVRKHFFASGRPGVRDDNAISKLWWNRHIAGVADPIDPEGALRIILDKADIRQALIERPSTGSRVPIIRAIIRALRNDPLLASTRLFKQLMVELNRDGGGLLFEALSEAHADELVVTCATKARAVIDNS